ncbi:MAG TPA: hypothetical protein VFH90_05685 [Candidatus Limnocylindria bacterium]|nr:hypothetical protein [Candidatus Limnocylindria bacterium]
MELTDLLPGIIGSFVGVMGWLLVGLYIQRRQFMRQARNAAKAVYFELDVNRTAIAVALDHGSFTPLNRSSFERLLPELATLLSAGDLKSVVGAYMAHAGYEQLAAAADLPAQVRKRALAEIAILHQAALSTLASRAFSKAEAHLMRASAADAQASADELRKVTS